MPSLSSAMESPHLSSPLAQDSHFGFRAAVVYIHLIITRLVLRSIPEREAEVGSLNSGFRSNYTVPLNLL